jgi:hypothetical protein
LTHAQIDKFVRNYKNTTNRSETARYLSDLDGVGCSHNRKTCPVVLVMVPRLEKFE